MPLNNLASEILSIPGVPDGARIEAIVGDTLSFVPSQTFAAPTVTLARKPAASTATVVSNGVTFDVAGFYRVTVAAGGFSRTIEVIAFPASALTLKVAPANPLSASVTRSHLRGLAMDSMVTLATMAASLEAATPTLIGITGGSSGPAWTQYGNA
ncbi:MAG: hypothetical protein M3O50_08445 [Myxococcota bacterium]|nr:hypothetical protein [Myxococcota bacterium]